MGNSNSLATAEENLATGAEAVELFKSLEVNANEGVHAADWEKAFEILDADGNGSISRKEWYLQAGTTEMYDAISKRSSGNITREEWTAAFEMLDVDKSGTICINEWLSRRKVRLGFIPIGKFMYNWGVGVGENFYEVISTSTTTSEMVVAGPNGILGLGAFVKQAGGTGRENLEKWMEGVKADIAVGDFGRDELMWLEEKSEPRARPEQVWQDFEQTGWTMKTDEEIEAWIKEWARVHPEYCHLDLVGRECNDQTFACEFISWLTNSTYSRMSDNTKSRAVVYGGLALLATAGGMYLASKMGAKDPADGEEAKK